MIAALMLSSSIVLTPGVYYSAPDVPAGTTVIANGVTFDGSRAAKLRRSGEYRWTPYKRLPVVDGHGIDVTGGQNAAKPTAKYADQAWSGNVALRQETRLSRVGPGEFWVGNGRLYVHKTTKSVRVSRLRSFNVKGTLVGATITRFSPTPADGAAVRLSGTLKNVRVTNSANVAVQVLGTTAKFDNVVIDRSSWMGVSLVKCRNVTMNNVTIRNTNYHREWATTPQSGAIKTSRCRGIDITNMRVWGQTGHGLWFDQSTVDVNIRNTRVEHVNGRALFFEISHGLNVYDSYFESTRASKFAGASGVRIYRTRFIPGYITPVDRRNCPDYRTPLCAGALSSDRLIPYDPRVTWVNDVKVIERLG